MKLQNRVALVAAGTGLLGTAIVPEQAQGARQRAALERAASVEDVADQVLTFCKSDSVTGQTVNVDAGVFFH